MSSVLAYLGLGSNEGDRRAYLEKALCQLSNHHRIELIKCTGFAQTKPWGVTDQPDFLNAVVQITTSLKPHELLRTCKFIEKELGRNFETPRWGPRKIDLDILLYGTEIVEFPDLIIPHASLHERSFILEQLLEIDPDIVHPRLRVPIISLSKKSYPNIT